MIAAWRGPSVRLWRSGLWLEEIGGWTISEVYGDYGEIGINSAGKAIAIWGEGFSYTGPGGVSLNREQ